MEKSEDAYLLSVYQRCLALIKVNLEAVMDFSLAIKDITKVVMSHPNLVENGHYNDAIRRKLFPSLHDELMKPLCINRETYEGLDGTQALILDLLDEKYSMQLMIERVLESIGSHITDKSAEDIIKFELQVSWQPRKGLANESSIIRNLAFVELGRQNQRGLQRLKFLYVSNILKSELESRITNYVARHSAEAGNALVLDARTEGDSIRELIENFNRRNWTLTQFTDEFRFHVDNLVRQAQGGDLRAFTEVIRFVDAFLSLFQSTIKMCTYLSGSDILLKNLVILKCLLIQKDIKVRARGFRFYIYMKNKLIDYLDSGNESFYRSFRVLQDVIISSGKIHLDFLAQTLYAVNARMIAFSSFDVDKQEMLKSYFIESDKPEFDETVQVLSSLLVHIFDDGDRSFTRKSRFYMTCVMKVYVLVCEVPEALKNNIALMRAVRSHSDFDTVEEFSKFADEELPFLCIREDDMNVIGRALQGKIVKFFDQLRLENHFCHSDRYGGYKHSISLEYLLNSIKFEAKALQKSYNVLYNAFHVHAMHDELLQVIEHLKGFAPRPELLTWPLDCFAAVDFLQQDFHWEYLRNMKRKALMLLEERKFVKCTFISNIVWKLKEACATLSVYVRNPSTYDEAVPAINSLKNISKKLNCFYIVRLPEAEKSAYLTLAMGLENANPLVYKTSMQLVKELRKLRRNRPLSTLARNVDEPEIIFKEEDSPDRSTVFRREISSLLDGLSTLMRAQNIRETSVADFEGAASRDDSRDFLFILTDDNEIRIERAAVPEDDDDSPAARGPPRNSR